ncbi:MAG: hypothetical protein CVT48_06530 [Thermoplasmata archaeon HGW-Thermoplasmata-1]|nr:MAG: hypothetical protein CVT48_06530 [Thermoplasmata archaeon HGW-Thermoplasmata-1]
MFVKHQSDVKAEPIDTTPGAKNGTIQWLINTPDAENFAMRRFVIGKGGHSPYHSHGFEHEVFVVSGKGVLVNGERDDEEIPLKSGSVVFVPGDEVHQFKNAGDDNFVFLCMVPLGEKAACGPLPTPTAEEKEEEVSGIC